MAEAHHTLCQLVYALSRYASVYSVPRSDLPPIRKTERGYTLQAIDPIAEGFYNKLNPFWGSSCTQMKPVLISCPLLFSISRGLPSTKTRNGSIAKAQRWIFDTASRRYVGASVTSYHFVSAQSIGGVSPCLPPAFNMSGAASKSAIYVYICRSIFSDATHCYLRSILVLVIVRDDYAALPGVPCRTVCFSSKNPGLTGTRTTIVYSVENLCNGRVISA